MQTDNYITRFKIQFALLSVICWRLHPQEMTHRRYDRLRLLCAASNIFRSETDAWDRSRLDSQPFIRNIRKIVKYLACGKWFPVLHWTVVSKGKAVKICCFPPSVWEKQASTSSSVFFSFIISGSFPVKKKTCFSRQTHQKTWRWSRQEPCLSVSERQSTCLFCHGMFVGGSVAHTPSPLLCRGNVLLASCRKCDWLHVLYINADARLTVVTLQ